MGACINILECIPSRRPIACWRRIQRDRSIRQRCWLGRYRRYYAIAASMTEHSKSDPTDALLQGYRAAFWTIFAATAIVVVLTFFGLRKAGLVGKKDD